MLEPATVLFFEGLPLACRWASPCIRSLTSQRWPVIDINLTTFGSQVSATRYIPDEYGTQSAENGLYGLKYKLAITPSKKRKSTGEPSIAGMVYCPLVGQ